MCAVTTDIAVSSEHQFLPFRAAACGSLRPRVCKTGTGRGPDGFSPYIQLGSAPARPTHQQPGSRSSRATPPRRHARVDDLGQGCASLRVRSRSLQPRKRRRDPHWKCNTLPRVRSGTFRSSSKRCKLVPSFALSPVTMCIRAGSGGMASSPGFGLCFGLQSRTGTVGSTSRLHGLRLPCLAGRKVRSLMFVGSVVSTERPEGIWSASVCRQHAGACLRLRPWKASAGSVCNLNLSHSTGASQTLASRF